MRRKHVLVVFALMVLMVSAPAFAQNLIANGSFETGYWTDWTTGGNFTDTEVVTNGFDAYSPEDGTYFAALGPVGSPGTLSQAFSDQAGTPYTFSFYLAASRGQPRAFLGDVGRNHGAQLDRPQLLQPPVAALLFHGNRNGQRLHQLQLSG